MLKRIRHLKISLAAKCQLLFGAAVVLIISAALFFPWHRIEQLTAQIDETSGHALVEAVLQSHVNNQVAQMQMDPTIRPRKYPTTGPTTAPAGAQVSAKLIGLNPKPGHYPLTPFEKRAIQVFQGPEREASYARTFDRPDGPNLYRYAEPVYLQKNCIQCHAPANVPVVATSTTQPASSKIIGVASVELYSQVAASQLLLNRLFLLTAGLLAGTLAIGVFYYIVTSLILQPVRVLQETASKVSEGDLNIRSDISTGDEFQLLSETFNTMLANLSASSEQLRAINKGLDIKLNQLAESNVALYESNKLKSEFLANVSHELRTPLNSILGFAEILKDSLAATSPESKSTRYVQNILQSGKALLDLINDLLDLAKIEAGKMEVRSEPLSIKDLFEGLANVLKPLTEQRGLTIIPVVANDVPILQTDPGKLQQILYNFLSNAIKFSPENGTIRLIAERDGEEHVKVAVADEGPGIGKEKQRILFEKFRQLDASATRKHGGTGLGLAISKELSSLLSGTVGVDTEEGKGATFWIRIPIKIAASVQDMRQRVNLA